MELVKVVQLEEVVGPRNRILDQMVTSRKTLMPRMWIELLEAEVVVTNSARTRVIIIIEGTRSHLHHHQGALRNQPILNQSEEEVKGHGQSKAVKIFGNVWVGEEDARRLQDLTNKLRAEGLSRKEILDALQGERRKAEKAANRQRDKTCFSCRQFGHGRKIQPLIDGFVKQITQKESKNVDNLIGRMSTWFWKIIRSRKEGKVALVVEGTSRQAL
jgi:hypothetical protein